MSKVNFKGWPAAQVAPRRSLADSMRELCKQRGLTDQATTPAASMPPAPQGMAASMRAFLAQRGIAPNDAAGDHAAAVLLEAGR